MAVKSIVRSVLAVALLVALMALPFYPPVKRLLEQVKSWLFIGQLAIAVGVTGLALIIAVFLMIRDRRTRARAAEHCADEGETA